MIRSTALSRSKSAGSRRPQGGVQSAVEVLGDQRGLHRYLPSKYLTGTAIDADDLALLEDPTRGGGHGLRSSVDH